MIAFTRHFPLVVPIPAFPAHPIPIFLEFYLPDEGGHECIRPTTIHILGTHATAFFWLLPTLFIVTGFK